MDEWIRFALFAGFGLAIGIVDFKTHKIPNIFLFTLILTLLAADVIWDYRAIPLRLFSGLVAYGLFYAVYRLQGGLGYGDVKYAGVIGYFLGIERVFSGLLCAVLLGLTCWSIGRLIFKWGREQRFPFGPWLSCGALLAVLVHRRII